jgi:hypothetical protein
LIAFGTAVTCEDLYARYAKAGIDAVAEPGALVMTRQGMSLPGAYNEMLAQASARDDLEAVALLHQDLRIEDPDFAAQVRSTFENESVAIAGAVGFTGFSGHHWVDGVQMSGGVDKPLHGQLVRLGWTGPYGRQAVEMVDGVLLILSPWAARNLRFDPRFARDFHGYDADICFEAQALGKQTVVTQIRTVHASIGAVGRSRGAWTRASLEFDRKWGDWLRSGRRTVPARPYAKPGPSLHERIGGEARAELRRLRGG